MQRESKPFLPLILVLGVLAPCLSPGVWAQEPPAPPPGFVQLDDYWLPASAVYGEGVYTATAWTNGVVPYVIAAGVTQTNRDRMLNAMAEIEALCPVNFVPRNGEANYIRIDNGTANLSTGVGMVGGQQ